MVEAADPSYCPESLSLIPWSIFCPLVQNATLLLRNSHHLEPKLLGQPEAWGGSAYETLPSLHNLRLYHLFLCTVLHQAWYQPWSGLSTFHLKA